MNADVLNFNIVIDFKAVAPAFDLEGFSVEQLSCTMSDLAWSMDLPAVNAADPEVQVLLDSTSSLASYFILRQGNITL